MNTLRTFFFRTEGPKGPRGGHGHRQGFVVCAENAAQAFKTIIADFGLDPLTVATEIKEIEDKAFRIYSN